MKLLKGFTSAFTSTFILVLLFCLGMPAQASAASAPRMASNLGVANNSEGNDKYSGTISASQGQLVQIRLYYVNKEADNSNKNAGNVRAKITMPQDNGKAATVKSIVQARDGSDIGKQVRVNLDRKDARLEFVPGSGLWRHNTGSREAPKYVTEKVSDELVTNKDGVQLGDQRPGEVFGSTITIKARVTGSAAKASIQTQQQNQSGQWSASNTAQPGQVMRVQVGYQNTSKSEQKDVRARVMLARDAVLLSGTTNVTNASRPAGEPIGIDAVDNAGIMIGNYAKGANAYVGFEVALPAADKLACGDNTLRHTAVVELSDKSQYWAYAVTKVVRDCGAAGPGNVKGSAAALPSVGADNVLLVFVGAAVTGAVSFHAWQRWRLMRSI